MTLLNSGSLNSAPLNSGESMTGFSETLSESISYLTLTRIMDIIYDSLNVQGAQTNEHSLIHIIIESLTNTDGSNTSAIFNNIEVDGFSLIDYINISYSLEVTESLSYSQTLSYIVGIVINVSDAISTLDEGMSRVIFKDTLVDLISLLDLSSKALSEGIIDTVSYISSLDHLYTAIAHVTSSLSLLDGTSAFIVIPLSVTSDILVNSAITNSALFRESINNGIVLQIPDGLVNSKYLAYLLSPETNSVSTYTNYNFNGCTKFGYKYLFYNKTGLYEHGGTTDSGSPILSEIETVAFNFNTSNLKQVPAIYLGVDSTDKVILKVRVDGKAEVHYQLNKFTNNLMTQKIDIGKGLIGRYFQFELLTEASEFNMESIEFYPLEIRRKL